MSPHTPPRWIVPVSLALVAGSASAHTGDHAAAGFASGLAHPFFGLDHLFAMFAVGLWAAQQGGRARWTIPLAFVAAMGLGGGLAWAGGALPGVEATIAASVLVLGLLVATRRAWALPAGVALVGAFALFHGFAHGTEMPQAASPLGYTLGFVLGTVVLHGAGMAASLFGRQAVRLAGAAIAAAGFAFVLGA